MDYIEYTMTYLHHTELAVLVEHPDDPNDPDGLWIPLSNIENGRDIDFDDYERGSHIELNIAEWWAINEGLE